MPKHMPANEADNDLLLQHLRQQSLQRRNNLPPFDLQQLSPVEIEALRKAVKAAFTRLKDLTSDQIIELIRLNEQLS